MSMRCALFFYFLFLALLLRVIENDKIINEMLNMWSHANTNIDAVRDSVWPIVKKVSKQTNKHFKRYVCPID